MEWIERSDARTINCIIIGFDITISEPDKIIGYEFSNSLNWLIFRVNYEIFCMSIGIFSFLTRPYSSRTRNTVICRSGCVVCERLSEIRNSLNLMGTHHTNVEVNDNSKNVAPQAPSSPSSTLSSLTVLHLRMLLWPIRCRQWCDNWVLNEALLL